MSKTNETRDVQTLAFGINANAQMGMAFGAATAATGTTLTTVTTASAANCFAGQAVWVNSAANTATQATAYYGLVMSNTNGANTVLTVDGWYTVAGAAGSTPSSTTFYVVGSPPPFWYIALSSSTDAVASGDTGQAMGGNGAEITTNGLSRALADTLTHTAASATTVVGKTFTYTGSGAQTVGRMMITNSRVASKGFGYFITAFASTATPSANGDTVTVTDTITVG